MPAYPYRCQKCSFEFDVYKSVADIDDPEICEKCEASAERYIATVNFTGASDWNTQHYNPALGQYVKSNKEAREIAKSKGMVEVGDEPLDKIHSKFDGERKKKIKSRYDSITSDLGSLSN